MKERQFLLWILLLAYLAGRVLQLFPEEVPGLVIAGLHVVPPILFAVIHGGRIYGLRGIFTLAGLCLIVGTISESLSLRTGFPFGHYRFTELMGPKLFDLPLLLALAYFGMGYLSWVIGLIILGYESDGLSGIKLFILPVTASLVMTTWDFYMEAVWADIDRAWVWRDGGPFYGVPISNFFGWLLTVYIFYQLFALYLRPRPTQSAPKRHWRLAILFYGVSALGNLLIAVPASLNGVFVDATGRPWIVSSILWASRLISIFLMMPLAVLAWIRAPGFGGARLPPARLDIKDI